MRQGVTNTPRAAAEFGGEEEFDDSGSVVEEEAVAAGGDGDQNALREASEVILGKGEGGNLGKLKKGGRRNL